MSIGSEVKPLLFNMLSLLNTKKDTPDAQLHTALNTLNDAATQSAIKLFELNNLEDAELPLFIAAASGNVGCQFALATCNAYRDGIWYKEGGGMSSHASEETKKWLRLAAAQNSIPALIQLGDTQSLEKAKALINAAPADEGPKGLYYMYLITNDFNWLEKSAAAGWDQAKYKLANFYELNPTTVANAALRQARIEELYQQSADAGLPLAVCARVFSETSTATLEEKQTRLAQLAWMGHVGGMLEYGYALANLSRSEDHEPATHEHPRHVRNKYGLKRDLGVAAGMLKFVLDQTAGAIKHPTLPADFHHIEVQLTPAERDKANATMKKLSDTFVRPFCRLEQLIIPRTATR